MTRRIGTIIPKRPAVPPAAALVGYNTRTLGPAVTLGGNWNNFNFFGQTQPGGSSIQNADGSVTLTGTSANSYNAGICSCTYNAALPNKFSGLAFGGGAYFEGILSFGATGVQSGSGFPAFWSMDIEHFAQNGADTYPGNAGLSRWAEFDFFEWIASDIHQYYCTLYDHYYNPSSPPAINVNTTGVYSIGAANFSTYNKYGALWVPATGTSQGYLAWYFNDQLIRAPAYWNLNSTSETPPPVAGSTLGNIADLRHMAVMFGVSNLSAPMQIAACSVWQASGASNITR